MTGLSSPPPPPDRLSIDPRSPYYNAAIMERDIGVRFNDHERTGVEEYCIGEDWIKVPAGKTLDRHAKLLLLKLNGRVEVYSR